MICICRGCIYDYSAFIFVNTTLIRWICVACRIRDCFCIGISDQSVAFICKSGGPEREAEARSEKEGKHAGDGFPFHRY